MIRFVFFLSVIFIRGGDLKKNPEINEINSLKSDSSIIIVSHNKESDERKMESRNEIERWELDNEDSDWLMEINENQNRGENLERNEYKLAVKSNGDNEEKNWSNVRPPQNITRLDGSGYGRDFRKSELNGDKLREMRNVTLEIGPTHDSSYKQMSPIGKTRNKKYKEEKKYVNHKVRKNQGEVLNVESPSNTTERIQLFNCTTGENYALENLKMAEPEIYSIKAFVEDNPKTKKDEPRPPEIYAIFGKIVNEGDNASKILNEKAEGKESKHNKTLSNLEMERALHIEMKGNDRGRIKEWRRSNKSKVKGNEFDELQTELIFDLGEERKTNYDIEKESNQSVTDSISWRESEVTIEDELEVINASEKADGRGFIEDPTSFLEDMDPYEIQNLKLIDESFLFSYLDNILYLFEPIEFPTELIKDIIWQKKSLISLATRSLKVEAGFIICLLMGIVLGLSVPAIILAYGCSSVFESDLNSNGDNQINDVGGCGKKAMVCLLTVVILLTCVGLTTMFVTNEQLSAALRQLLRILEISLNDVSAYFKNAQKQLNSVVVTGFDKIETSFIMDLENIGHLLGLPIQKKISIETGIDVVLDDLVELTAGSQNIKRKIDLIKDESRKLKIATESIKERLADLRQQLEGVKRHCPLRDRLLCEGIDSSALRISFHIDPFLNDPKLTLMKILIEDLYDLTDKAKMRFKSTPRYVDSETKKVRLGIRSALSKQKSILDNALWPFENLVYDLKLKIEDARDSIRGMQKIVLHFDYYRWLVQLVSCFVFFFIWLLLTVALACSICEAKEVARLSLIGSILTLCIFSILLWLVTIGVFFIGGHGKVFICRPLFDEPNFDSLTKLFDDPGAIFSKRIFPNLYSNQTLNVPLKEILQDCRAERPIYRALRLERILDLDAALNHYKWDSIHLNLKNLHFNLTGFQILDPELHLKLESLLQTTAVNLTAYRGQLTKMLTGKDLNSFAKQLDHVANQMKDLLVASKFETLASRMRRVAVNFLLPLQSKQEDLIYQLTILEVQMKPLQREINKTLEHLKTIQHFFENQGSDISRKKAQEFSNRLISYLDQYRNYVLESLNDYIAPCKPIWDVYHALRVQLCRHVMDPINGFWFSAMLCLVLFTFSIALSLKLIAYYNLEKKGTLTVTNGTSSATENEGIWNTSRSVQSNDW